MIYTNVPEHMKLDTNLFEIEMDFFFKNLPPQEQNKLNQFNSSNLCTAYYIDVYKPAADECLWNIQLNLIDKEPIDNQKIFNSKYISSQMDNNIYEYKNKYNFFEKTINQVKLNKNIKSITLLYFKPKAILFTHIHVVKEFVSHVILNDMKGGHLNVHSEDDRIQLNKKGQYIMHETHLPHGGSTTSSEAWVLSVTSDYKE